MRGYNLGVTEDGQDLQPKPEPVTGDEARNDRGRQCWWKLGDGMIEE